MLRFHLPPRSASQATPLPSNIVQPPPLHVARAFSSNNPIPQRGTRSPSGRLNKLHLERSRNDTEEAAARFRPEEEGKSPRAVLQDFLNSSDFTRQLRSYGYTDDRQDAEARHSLLRLQAELFELHASYNYSFLEQYMAPSALIDRVLDLCQLLGQETVSDCCHIVRSKPLILEAENRDLIRRLMALKLIMPRAHWGCLLSLYPALLYVPLESVEAAERKMQSLMPGLCWQSKLRDGSAAFYSFQEIVQTEVQNANRNRNSSPN